MSRHETLIWWHHLRGCVQGISLFCVVCWRPETVYIDRSLSQSRVVWLVFPRYSHSCVCLLLDASLFQHVTVHPFCPGHAPPDGLHKPTRSLLARSTELFFFSDFSGSFPQRRPHRILRGGKHALTDSSMDEKKELNTVSPLRVGDGKKRD